MRLILTPWKNLLFERARAAKKSVTLISPFIKSNIVNGLLSEISDAAISVKAALGLLGWRRKRKAIAA
jgi:hypothetical protein